jgi:hypothetical protein
MTICTSCGQETDMTLRGVCRACIDFGADDDEFDPEGPAFECAGFDDGSGFYCPLWGTEECDWECPENA